MLYYYGNFSLIGEAHYELGDHADAETSYKQSLNAKPDHIPAHLTLARLMSKTVRYIPILFDRVTLGSAGYYLLLYTYITMYEVWHFDKVTILGICSGTAEFR